MEASVHTRSLEWWNGNSRALFGDTGWGPFSSPSYPRRRKCGNKLARGRDPNFQEFSNYLHLLCENHHKGLESMYKSLPAVSSYASPSPWPCTARRLILRLYNLGGARNEPSGALLISHLSRRFDLCVCASRGQEKRVGDLLISMVKEAVDGSRSNCGLEGLLGPCVNAPRAAPILK